ncbi:MAG: site-specific integrase [Rudaea sp.]|uniref:tyrosine-type recombinase/integrase n=1 Tax=Rudaea sp. TaxID=2136325 RepID=UPI0039E213D7
MRIGANGSTWIARYYDPDTHPNRPAKTLGDFATMPPSDRYTAAKKAAEEWFDHLTGGGSNAVLTVRQACESYAEALARDGETRAKEARRRFAQYVYGDPIEKVVLLKLTDKHVKAWRQRLEDLPVVSYGKKGERITSKRSRATVNRDMVCFRAALNKALDDGAVLTARAWDSALRPHKGTGARRNIYLDRDQRKALIAALLADAAAFVRGLCALPVRPGALAAFKVGDFDARRNELVIAKDKAGQDRRILLPVETVALFKEQARHKLPGAYLFTRADGRPWVKDAWKGPIKDAVRAAELPERTTAYTLRHSTITDLITGGLDLFTVAKVSGTSVKMIEEHYGHLRGEHAAKALAGLAL